MVRYSVRKQVFRIIRKDKERYFSCRENYNFLTYFVHANWTKYKWKANKYKNEEDVNNAIYEILMFEPECKDKLLIEDEWE